MPIRGTWLHPEAKSPLTTSLIVPSPPTITIVSARPAAAAAANSSACLGAVLGAKRKGNPCLRRRWVISRSFNPHRPQLALSLTITTLEHMDARDCLLLLNSGWQVYGSSGFSATGMLCLASGGRTASECGNAPQTPSERDGAWDRRAGASGSQTYDRLKARGHWFAVRVGGRESRPERARGEQPTRRQFYRRKSSRVSCA